MENELIRLSVRKTALAGTNIQAASRMCFTLELLGDASWLIYSVLEEGGDQDLGLQLGEECIFSIHKALGWSFSTVSSQCPKISSPHPHPWG